MYAISLTSIPPRFDQLPRVLSALMAQSVPPETVFLVVPKSYARFDVKPLPALPFGVTLLQPDADPGPIGKLLPAAEVYDGDLLICDDDWLYAPDWAEAFLDRRKTHPSAVLAATVWNGSRIGHPGTRILQGFGGALIPAHMAREIPAPPRQAWTVDDVWVSGHLPPAVEVTTVRRLMRPISDPGSLQSDPDRDAANRWAAAHAPWPGHAANP